MRRLIKVVQDREDNVGNDPMFVADYTSIQIINDDPAMQATIGGRSCRCRLHPDIYELWIETIDEAPRRRWRVGGNPLGMLECHESLVEAIENANGSHTQMTSTSRLKSLSAMALLELIAPNDIRFTHSPK